MKRAAKRVQARRRRQACESSAQLAAAKRVERRLAPNELDAFHRPVNYQDVKRARRQDWTWGFDVNAQMASQGELGELAAGYAGITRAPGETDAQLRARASAVITDGRGNT